MLWANPKEIADEKIATFKRPCPTNTDLACHLLARSAGLPALKGFVVSLTPKLSDADPSSTTFGGSESLLRGIRVRFSWFQSHLLFKKHDFS